MEKNQVTNQAVTQTATTHHQTTLQTCVRGSHLLQSPFLYLQVVVHGVVVVEVEMVVEVMVEEEVEVVVEDKLMEEVEGCAPAGPPGLPPHPHHHLAPKVLQEEKSLEE